MTSRQRAGAARRRSLAPHVDEAWAEAFVLELRLLGVGGSRIGEALAEVDAHCADGDETAAAAFGDPVAYARSLGERVELPTGELVQAVAPTALQVGGLLLTLWAVPALLAGGPAAMTMGQLVSAGLVLGAIGVLVRAADPALRVVVRRPVLATLAFVALTWLMVGALVVLDGVVATVPAGALLAGGVAALVAGTVWHVLGRRGHGADDDPVTTPFGEQVGDSGRPARVAGALTPWLVPAAAVVSLAVTLALRT